jgi:hypothetical protein
MWITEFENGAADRIDHEVLIGERTALPIIDGTDEPAVAVAEGDDQIAEIDAARGAVGEHTQPIRSGIGIGPQPDTRPPDDLTRKVSGRVLGGQSPGFGIGALPAGFETRLGGVFRPDGKSAHIEAFGRTIRGRAVAVLKEVSARHGSQDPRRVVVSSRARRRLRARSGITLGPDD